MKSFSMPYFAGLLSLAATLPVPKPGQPIKTETVIVALEQQWVDAEQANNPDKLAELLADGFVNTYDGAVTGKAELVASAKTTKWDGGRYDSLKVAVFGNAAIAIGILRRNRTDKTGKHVNVNERFTDTWLKMPTGQWQCVASHGSTITS